MIEMNDKYKGEKVLAVPTAILAQMGIGEGLGGSRYIEGKLKAMFDLGEAAFYDRAKAEKDPTLKQIIPYIIFKHDRMVFSYVRGKGTAEERLKGNRSIGIGGHINPVDGGATRPEYDTYQRALNREIGEEVEFYDDHSELITKHVNTFVPPAKIFRPTPIAFINDNSNSVGRVHLGVVHLCELESQCVRRKEEQISKSGFLSLDKFDRHVEQTGGSMRNELENWSLLCVDYLMS